MQQELANVEQNTNAEAEPLGIEQEAWDKQLELARRFGEQELAQRARDRRAIFDEEVHQWEEQHQAAFTAEANSRKEAFDEELETVRQAGREWIPRYVTEKLSEWDGDRQTEAEQRESDYDAGTDRIRTARAELIAKYGEARLAAQIRQWKKDDAWRNAQSDVQTRVGNQKTAEVRTAFLLAKTIESRNHVEAKLASMQADFLASQNSHRENFARELAEAKRVEVASFEAEERELLAQERSELNHRILALNSNRLKELSSRVTGDQEHVATAYVPNLHQVTWNSEPRTSVEESQDSRDWVTIQIARGALLCVVACFLIWSITRNRRRDSDKS